MKTMNAKLETTDPEAVRDTLNGYQVWEIPEGFIVEGITIPEAEKIQAELDRLAGVEAVLTFNGPPDEYNKDDEYE